MTVELVEIEGHVKWFDDKKGFGFIVADSGDLGDIFVHHTAIEGKGHRTLVEGERVRFFLQHATEGLRARSVTRLTVREFSGTVLRSESYNTCFVIQPDDFPRHDVFAHYSVIEGEGKKLKQNERVWCQCSRTATGLRASRVKRLTAEI